MEALAARRTPDRRAVRRLQRRADAGAAARTASASSTTPTATASSALGRPLLRVAGAAAAGAGRARPAHPFPQVANKSLNFIARLAGKDAFGRATRSRSSRCRGSCRGSSSCRRGGPEQSFVLLTSVIRAHLGRAVPGPRGRGVLAVPHHPRLRPRGRRTTSPTCARRCARAHARATIGQAVRLEVVNTCRRAVGLPARAVRPARVGAVQGQRAGQPGAHERADRPGRGAATALSALSSRPGRRALPRQQSMFDAPAPRRR
jgi:polyphosphate kinase